MTTEGASAEPGDGRAEAPSSCARDRRQAGAAGTAPPEAAPARENGAPDEGARLRAASDAPDHASRARTPVEGDAGDGRAPDAGGPAAALAISTLPKRRDFLAAARARRWSAPGMVVQARERRADEPAATPVRVGYTCSKKVGNAVKRNRAKRRLRAAAAEALPRAARPGWDYVLIGRAGATADRPFPELVADLETALANLHAGKGAKGGPPKRKGRK